MTYCRCYDCFPLKDTTDSPFSCIPMYGHSSKYMAEKYAKIIKKVYAHEIIEKSPNF